MKKHPVNKTTVPAIHSLHPVSGTQKLQDIPGKKSSKLTVAVPPPPDEATLELLNKIAKESPFCYYFKGKSNDTL